MSEASRQRWLHVQNRLEELNARLGQLQDEPLPEWLDHHPEPRPRAVPVPSVRPVRRPGIPLEDEGA